MSSKPKYTEEDIIAAYRKLQEITKDLKAPDSKRADVEKQVKIICAQMWQQDEDELAPDGLERRAELALNEGHVELFEKVCDWCKVGCVKSQEDMGAWYQSYEWLRNVVHYRAGHSIKLGTRLANSKQYFKSIEMYLRWHINTEKDVAAMIKNTIVLCDTAPAAIGTGRGLYQLVLEIYTTSKNDTVRVLCLMLLSTLATEKEAKELLNESSLSSLVDFLKRSVRNELPKEGPLWTLRRRTMAIRTLEKMITSDESVVPTFLKLNLLTLLEAALKAQNATQAEICAALTCVLTLSHNIEALQSISKDAELVKCCIEQCSKSTDSEQVTAAKKIMESIHGLTILEETSALKDKEAPIIPTVTLRARTEATATKPILSTSAKAAPATPASGTTKEKQVEEITEKETGGAEPRVGDKSTPVFISYQSAYTERVLKIKRALEACGIPCWMATENMVGNVQDAIGEALMVAPAIIICLSHSYRNSVYVQIEANTALRWKIPMVACCVEEGYEADYWLGVITSAAPGLDFSTDAKFSASFERLVKELRSAHRVIKTNANVSSQQTTGKVEKPVILPTAHLGLALDQSNVKKKESFANWDVKQAGEWLKSLSLYDDIPNENRAMIDGAFLKELRTMKREAPAEFGTSLKEVFQFNTVTTIKFRAELDKLE